MMDAAMLERAYIREKRKNLLLERLIANKSREVFYERQELDSMSRYLRSILETMADALLVCSADLTVMLVNHAAVQLVNGTREDLIGTQLETLLTFFELGTLAQLRSSWEKAAGGWSGETQIRDAQGRLISVSMSLTAMRDPHGAIVGHVCVLHNLTDRKLLESRLMQAQKLESVGTLAAGIAHEINTPVQYVGDNTHYLVEAFKSYRTLIEQSATLLDNTSANSHQWKNMCIQHDLTFLEQEVPRALEQSLEGVKRVAAIVRALKEFAHPDGNEKSQTDVNHAISSTVTVSRNEWKYVADVELELAKEQPSAPLYPGEFNQAILNLIVNAADAIEGRFGKESKQGKIQISTSTIGSELVVRVRDNGTGIPADVRDKIFVPFFTTKEVGRGSGQGLAQVRHCVVNRHGGTVTFETEIGQGTCFEIRIPLNPTKSEPRSELSANGMQQ